jgi:cytochrome c-type biogenesis protein
MLSDWGIAFAAGLLAPLGAVCVLPLYPGYLSFLSRQAGAAEGLRARIILGLIAGGGILVSMLAFGLIVVSLLALPLSGALGIISPAAYSVLLVIGLLFMTGWRPEIALPSPRIPEEKSPFLGAFVFGLFFGILILPCNAAPIAILLALSTSALGFLSSLTSFILFGAGMAVPLVALSALSTLRGNQVSAYLVKHRRIINMLTGALMVAVSVYYLFGVFRVQDMV